MCESQATAELVEPPAGADHPFREAPGVIAGSMVATILPVGAVLDVRERGFTEGPRAGARRAYMVSCYAINRG